MELIFKDVKIQFDQQPNVDNIIEKINGLLEDHQLYFSHLIADGVDVYGSTEQYLTENLTSIEKLEVIVRTQKEFQNDILLTAEDYLNRASLEISGLIEGFYNGPTSEHWSSFKDMLEGIQWINQIVVSIDQMKEKPNNWEAYLQHIATLEVELKNIEDALKNGDHILMADIIQYELLPIYEELKNEISKTIDTEGIRYDVN